MAGDGSGKTFTKVLENLEADVTCGICYEQYREPKLLPCAHYFCRRCVKRVAQHADGKPFPCPICQEMTTLPPHGVDELPSAFFVEHLLAVHRAFDANKEELRGPRKMTCDVCKSEGVTSFCKECDQFLCTPCLENHQTTAVYAQHQLMSIEELRARRENSGRSRNMSLLGRSDSTASYAGRPFVSAQNSVDKKGKQYTLCTKHPDEPIKVYCRTHDMLVCRDCTIYDHPRPDCKTGFIRDEAPKARRALADALVPVEEAHKSILAAESDLVAIHERVCAQEAEQLEAVRLLFEDVRTRVSHCEDTLLGGVEAVSQGKKDMLTSQKELLQISKQEVKTSIDAVQQDIDNLMDDEILMSYRQLEVKIQKEIAHHHYRNLEPDAHADMIRLGPSLDDFPTKRGLAYPRMDQRHLRIEPPEKIFVGSKVDYKIHVPYSIGDEVEVEVQSLVDEGCVIRAKVVPWREKEVVLREVVVARYDVTFTPRVRGHHKLSTKINGQELPGSPFKPFAHIHPTHLGFVVRQSGEAGKPYGIAITCRWAPGYGWERVQKSALLVSTRPEGGDS